MSDKVIFASSLTEVSATARDRLGSIQWKEGKAYKYVLYDDGAANLDVVAGDVVFYKAITGYGANIVTPDQSDSSGQGAGVVQATVTDDQRYIWIQIKGGATLNTALTAGVDGNSLTGVGAGDKTLDVSAAVTDPICAYVIEESVKQIICDFPF